MKNKSLCVAPWNHVFINTEGHFYHCCMAEAYSSPISHNGVKLHVSTVESFEEVLNSSDSQELKQQMLRGELPASCQKCHLEERVRSDFSNGQPGDTSGASKSYRRYLNKKYHKKLEQIISTQSTLISNHDINFLDMRPGNTCNLKCRMCYPVSSKLWIDDWIKLFPDSMDEKRIKELRTLNWGESAHFWNLIHGVLSSIETIHFAGGEPLYMKDVLYFLKSEQYALNAHEINLTFNTNLTNLNSDILESWKKFKSIRLMISLDGTSSSNDYIRYPSKAVDVLKNIQKLSTHENEINFQHCGLITTVQIYNIHTIVEFTRTIIALNNPIIGERIKFNLLNEPDCFSIQCLPQALKIKYSQELNNFAIWLQENNRIELAEETRSIIKFMHLNDLEHLLSETKRRTEILDKERKQNLKEVAPDLWTHLQQVEIK